MYVAGTHTALDVYDDIRVAAGLKTFRSRQVEDAWNRNITRLVGHSLGGTAVLEAQLPILAERRIAINPGFSPLGSYQPGKIVRHVLDPVSVMGSARSKNLARLANPHAYQPLLV